MWAAMVEGLRGWAASDLRRDVGGRFGRSRLVAASRLGERRSGSSGSCSRGGPTCSPTPPAWFAPGNTVVFRIGSDALGTAQGDRRRTPLRPALASAGLPGGTVALVESAAHAAGWALFSDRRLSLAVARGSGPAVAQLGAVARQAGVPVSLHGTGGAWMVAAGDADRRALRGRRWCTRSTARCATRSTCAASSRSGPPSWCRVFLDQARAAGQRAAPVHACTPRPAASKFVPDEVAERALARRARRWRARRAVRDRHRRRPARSRVGVGALAGGHAARRRPSSMPPSSCATRSARASSPR